MQSDLRTRVVRRFVVAASIFVIFLLWIGPPRSVRENVLPAVALIGVSAVIALFLSWPRQKWMRVAAFVVLAAFVALRPLEPSGELTIVELLIRVFPVLFLVTFIFLLDQAVAFLLRRLSRSVRSPAA